METSVFLISCILIMMLIESLLPMPISIFFEMFLLASFIREDSNENKSKREACRWLKWKWRYAQNKPRRRHEDEDDNIKGFTARKIITTIYLLIRHGFPSQHFHLPITEIMLWVLYTFIVFIGWSLFELADTEAASTTSRYLTVSIDRECWGDVVMKLGR